MYISSLDEDPERSGRQERIVLCCVCEPRPDKHMRSMLDLSQPAKWGSDPELFPRKAIKSQFVLVRSDWGGKHNSSGFSENSKKARTRNLKSDESL